MGSSGIGHEEPKCGAAQRARRPGLAAVPSAQKGKLPLSFPLRGLIRSFGADSEAQTVCRDDPSRVIHMRPSSLGSLMLTSTVFMKCYK
jgi:hypothetical protein